MTTRRNPYAPPYKSLEHARKIKARIFGAELADVVVKVARATVRGDQAAIDRALALVRPNSRPDSRQRRIENVVRHARDLECFFAPPKSTVNRKKSLS